MLLSSLEQQRSGAFEVHQTFLVCQHHAFQLFTELCGEQDAQQALSPLLLGISDRGAHWICCHSDSQRIFHGVVRISDLSDSLVSTPYGSIWNGLDI
jgi:hypothetical protein